MMMTKYDNDESENNEINEKFKCKIDDNAIIFLKSYNLK